MLPLILFIFVILFSSDAMAEPRGLLAVATATPVPAGPLPALVAALRRPLGTPAFPYGQQHPATQAIYFLLRSRASGDLQALRDVLHREPVWLRQLTEETRRQGFDPLSSSAEAEGGRLLWQLVPCEYPPLRAAQAAATRHTTSTSFYDPVSGMVDVAPQTARWPRAVSLIHEAMHALQSRPGSVSFALLRQSPWTARTWVYSATYENPAALEMAVECGPSLLTGLAIAEIYHRAVPQGPAIRTALVTPRGREFNTEWLLRQAHRYGVFGDTATARAMGRQHDGPSGINDLLGRTQAGQQFVEQLLPER